MTASPTITSPAATRIGMILGTAAYMSPEQARGKPVDKRTDIWAFGCVLYEMLTGTRAFGGDEITDTLAFIITKDVDWSALPAATPPAILRLLRRCLEKDRRERLADISVARLEIKDAVAAPATAVSVARRPSRAVWAAVTVLAITVVALLPFAVAQLRQVPAPVESIQFPILAPEGGFFTGGAASAPAPAVSPDGRQIVFRAQHDGIDQLWLRRLGSIEARPLAGTTGGDLPFWSPDSRFIAFFAGSKLLKIEIATGGVQPLADAPRPEGGTWGRDGTILFAGTPNSGLSRVSAAGGSPETVTSLDASAPRPHTSHRWPHFLPDGRRFLFLVQPGNEIHLGSLDAPQSTRLFTADSKALYSNSGHVLFVRRTTLFAQPFDEKSGTVRGEPVTLASRVIGNTGNGRSVFSVSGNGVLAYRSGSFGESLVTWFDRSGKPLGSVGEIADYRHIAIAPNGRQAVVHIHDDADGGGGLWMLDLIRGTTSRFTFGPSHEGAAIWSPDGADIFYDSQRDTGGHVYRKPASGAAAEELVIRSDVTNSLRAISPDGRMLAYAAMDPKTLADIWTVPLSGDLTPVPRLRGPFDEDHPEFSPDGRWIAYASNETGRVEVYIQSAVSAMKLQISTAGGA